MCLSIDARDLTTVYAFHATVLPGTLPYHAAVRLFLVASLEFGIFAPSILIESADLSLRASFIWRARKRSRSIDDCVLRSFFAEHNNHKQ
jgi:hypothetical protein